MDSVPGLRRGRSPSGSRGNSRFLFSVRQGGVKVGKVHLERVRRVVSLLLLLLLLGSPGLSYLLPGLLPGSLNRLPGHLPGSLNG